MSTRLLRSPRELFVLPGTIPRTTTPLSVRPISRARLPQTMPSPRRDPRDNSRVFRLLCRPILSRFLALGWVHGRGGGLEAGGGGGGGWGQRRGARAVWGCRFAWCYRIFPSRRVNRVVGGLVKEKKTPKLFPLRYISPSHFTGSARTGTGISTTPYHAHRSGGIAFV